MFTDCSRAIVNTLIKNGYLEIIEQKVDRNPLDLKDAETIKKTEKTEKLQLTEEQEDAYQKIKEKIEQNKYQSFLLYGVTGSRKDRNLFTIDTTSDRTRNIFNTTNVRPIYCPIWKRRACRIT